MYIVQCMLIPSYSSFAEIISGNFNSSAAKKSNYLYFQNNFILDIVPGRIPSLCVYPRTEAQSPVRKRLRRSLKPNFSGSFFFFKSLSHNKCCTQDGETSSQDVTCNTQVELEKLVSPISCPVCMPGTKPVPALCTLEFFQNRFLHFCYELLQSQPMHLYNFIHAVLPFKNKHFSFKNA